jgi:hypothetical protein
MEKKEIEIEVLENKINIEIKALNRILNTLSSINLFGYKDSSPINTKIDNIIFINENNKRTINKSLDRIGLINKNLSDYHNEFYNIENKYSVKDNKRSYFKKNIIFCCGKEPVIKMYKLSFAYLQCNLCLKKQLCDLSITSLHSRLITENRKKEFLTVLNQQRREYSKKQIKLHINRTNHNLNLEKGKKK